MSEGAATPSEPGAEQGGDSLTQLSRDVLEQLTGARWLLNDAVEPGTSWVHPAGPSDPEVGPDTSIPTYIINPADLGAVLSSVVQVDPGDASG